MARPAALRNEPSDISMNEQCVEELRAVRDAAEKAAISAHEVSTQLKRIADLGEGLQGTVRRWTPRLIAGLIGAAATAGGASPILTALLHPH